MVVFLMIIGAIVAVFLLALVFLPSFIDESAIVALAQEQVRKTTGGELTVEGGIDITLFPDLTLVLDDASIDLPPRGPEGSRMVADVDNVDIELSIIPILMGRTEVGQVRLVSTNLRIFDDAGSVTTQLLLKELVAEGLNTANSPMALRAELQVDNPEGGPPIVVKLDGTVRIPADFSVIGIDRLQTDITGVLPEVIKTTLQGKIVVTPLGADLKLVANLPGGDIDGDLVYAAAESPQIDLVFNTQRLDLDKLAPPQTNTADKQEDTGIKPPPMPVPVGPLKDLDMRLAVTADALLSNGQEITNAQLLVRVVDGISDMKYLRGVLHKGQLDTNMQIDVRKPVIAVNLEGGLKGVDIDSLMVSLGNKNMAEGRVDMDWEIETAGRTTEDLQLGLDGDLNLNGRDVTIVAASVQDLMCKAIAEVNQEQITKPMPAYTEVSALRMGIEFDDGEARLATMNLATPGVQLEGEGKASLSDLQFQTRFIARVNKDLEKLDKACRVEDRYVAIDWPILCRGNLTEPPAEWCAIDVNGIVQQLIKNEARSELQKQADKLGKEAGSLLKNLFGN